MDTFSLSRTVFEIFEFKVLGVWPWPLTPKGNLGSKKITYPKGHIWLPIWLLWTPSLYLVSFSRYSTSKFWGFDLDLWPQKLIWSQIFYTIEKPIYDFLFDFYGHHLFISYRSRDNGGQNFEEVKVKNRFFTIIKRHLLLTKRRRLRYCASKLVQLFRLYPCQRA